MSKELIDALIAVYRGNNDDDKKRVASLYFKGARDVEVNHRAAQEIYSDLRDHNKNVIVNDVDANLCLGLYAYLRKRNREAIEYLIRVPADNVRADIWFSLGNWAYESKLYADAAKLYSLFLASCSGDYPKNLIDFVKSRGLSSVYYMGRVEDFYEGFIKKAKINAPISDENIKLFCNCRKKNQDVVAVLERIYGVSCINEHTKQEIAQRLADFYISKGDPRRAMFWAKRARDTGAINKLKGILHAAGGRRKFGDSLKAQFFTIAHVLAIFLVLLYWFNRDAINSIVNALAYCSLGFFAFNLLRYFLFTENRKVTFFLRVMSIGFVLTTFIMIRSRMTIDSLSCLAIAYSVPFFLIYTIIFFMKPQLDNFQRDTERFVSKLGEIIKNFIRSFE